MSYFWLHDNMQCALGFAYATAMIDVQSSTLVSGSKLSVCLAGVRLHQSGDVGMKEYAFTSRSACCARYVVDKLLLLFATACQAKLLQ